MTDSYYASALVQQRQKTATAGTFGRHAPESHAPQSARQVSGATAGVRRAELTAERNRNMETPR